WTDVAGGKVVKMAINDLLGNIELENSRNRKSSIADGNALRLFYSYSHKDENLRDELETHLKIFQRQGLIEQWHDRKITAGDDWKTEIDEHLEQADIILLLVSADFIDSDFCYELEMERAVERHKSKEAVVVPIIVRAANWHKTPFGPIQALPKDGKAVTAWSNKDEAWLSVSKGIERILETWPQNNF
ncbi:MAG: toll/interleukin-1 receptor domain-containing protein, partial [Chloroflexi bacterium]|nr:toll/interleukin-1 receptor domain-containing protein [Chloroflexota bacterium]